MTLGLGVIKRRLTCKIPRWRVHKSLSRGEMRRLELSSENLLVSGELECSGLGWLVLMLFKEFDLES